MYEVKDILQPHISYKVTSPAEAATKITELFLDKFPGIQADFNYMKSYFCLIKRTDDHWECACNELT